MRVALACLIALGAQAALPLDVHACDSGPPRSESRSRLLGVDADGNFVQYQESWGDYSDGLGRGFVAYDKDGKTIASFDLDGGEPTGDYFSAVLRAQVTDAKIIEADLIAAKRLEAPTPRKMRHVGNETRCGSLEIDSKVGWLRVAEVGVLSQMFPKTCAAISVQGFEHPKVNVTFVRARFQMGSRTGDDGYVAQDRVHILPNARIEAAELTLLGERARLGDDMAKAIPLIERAIEIAPEYVPARSSLIRAYAKAGRSWEDLVERLDTDIPEGRTVVGAVPSKALLGALPRLWKEAADDERTWTWSADEPPMFAQSFI
jgi:hypothetical protein